MKYRLDSPHYIDDRLLDEGYEIGDGTAVPFRDDKGAARPPSRMMIPLDEEAKALYRKQFKDLPPIRDPLEAIPVLGTFSEAKAPGGTVKGPVK